MAGAKPAHLTDGLKTESLACDYLRRQGLDLLERNYRSPHGEIGLVAEHAGALVFVEVRFRRDNSLGTRPKPSTAANSGGYAPPPNIASRPTGRPPRSRRDLIS